MNNVSTIHTNKVAITILYEGMPEWRNGRRSGFKICLIDIPTLYAIPLKLPKPIIKGLFYRFIIKYLIATITIHNLAFS